MKEPQDRVDINYQQFSNMLTLVTTASIGESSPVFLEEKVKELREIIPFLPSAVSWMREALDRAMNAKDGNIETSPEDLRDFLTHNEMLCRCQGAVAALLCVAEDIRTRSLPVPKPQVKRVRKKKS